VDASKRLPVGARLTMRPAVILAFGAKTLPRIPATPAPRAAKRAALLPPASPVSSIFTRQDAPAGDGSEILECNSNYRRKDRAAAIFRDHRVDCVSGIVQRLDRATRKFAVHVQVFNHQQSWHPRRASGHR